jgi:uncharacterized protein (TIGR00369 family)
MANAFATLRAVVMGELPQPPVAQLVGFRLTAISPDASIVELDVDERHADPTGWLHGGILCDIADAAMDLAYATTLKQNEAFSNLELKINFLRPVRHGRLRAIGRVVRADRTISLVESDVVDEQGRLVARATGTFMTLRPPQRPDGARERSDFEGS